MKFKMDKFKKYHDAVRFIEKLDNISNDVWPDRFAKWEVRQQKTKFFLKLIGNPEKGLKVIHVTGTAGKGSVANMLHEILLDAGKKVGSYTSPYVTSAIEKIKAGRKYISPNEFVSIMNRFKPLIERAYIKNPNGGPSYAVIYVAMSLQYFKNQNCEWAILEAPVGGNSAVTNAIEDPKAAAITNIGYDHMKTLGNTINKIAADKAGVIKPGTIFWTAEQRPRLVKFFKDICKERGAVFNQVPRQNNWRDYNIELVRSIAKSIGIEESFIHKGIKNAKLPGRFEVMQKSPLVIIDVAHNKDKIASTAGSLKNHKYKKLHLILALGESKDKKILNEIIPKADHVYFTRFTMSTRRCANPVELAKLSKPLMKRGAKSEIFIEPRRALQQALKNASKDDAILITGSFFLSGDLRQHWYPEEYILKNRKSF